jgi:predicted extracellular nuclease
VPGKTSLTAFALLLPFLVAGQGNAQPPVSEGFMPATIMQIQGSGQFSPLKGRFVETSGVVTLVTAKKDGFWIQDPAGDGDPATSDGIFVTGIPGVITPDVGDAVQAVGRVEEEQKANELPRTRLYAMQSPEVLSKGNPLPAPVPLTKLPDVSIAEGIAFWEALEGMRVSIENAPVISPTNRFGQFTVLAPGNAVPGSGYYPQSGRLLVRSLGGDQVDYGPERILVASDTLAKPIAASAGDQVTTLTAVVDYTFNYYKVQLEPGSAKLVTHELPKAPVSVRSGPPGDFAIITYNLWDFFTAVPQGKNERYALKPDDLEKRIAKIAQSVVTELKLPQIIAVQELEGANLEPVVQRINALAGDRYKEAWLPTSDWRGLTTGFIYDATRVKLEKLYQVSSSDLEGTFGQKSAMGNREPLVGVFSVGEGLPPLIVICNKLKTKRLEESPFSLEPPFRFTEVQRKAQARIIRRFLDSLFAKDPNAWVVVTGDLGDYDFSEPGEGADHALAILEGTAGQVPMTNLLNRVDEAQRFDYLFQGGGVAVSHTLVSPALLKKFVAADVLHFNTAFPEDLKWDTSTAIRASDRDPLEVRFQLGAKALPAAKGADRAQGKKTAASSPSGFQRAYEAGTRDPNGQYMGGTEMFTLASHAGKLWAATGYYWDLPGKDPSPGAQVLVLDRPGGTWRVNHQFDTREWRTSLDAVTFTTDGKGEKLAHPASMLVAVPTNPVGKLVVHVRDEERGFWTAAPLATGGKVVSARSAFMHRDQVTGVDRVLVATYPNGVFSGVYDPAAPTRILWEQAPELTGYDRPMGFAECNGSIYLTAKDLYRRVDGESPRWEKVYSFEAKVLKPGVGMRGLAAIPNPQGPGEILLIALDGNPAKILRIDPALGHKATEELDVLELLTRQWGRRPSAAVPAYNGMTPVTDPRTGETVHLMGLAANFSAAASAEEYPKEGWERGGWYLIRHADGRYEMRQILDESKPRLVATREIKVSPFDDRTLYFAGYNPNTNLSHNTAWIYSAPVAAALAPQRPATEEPPVAAIMKIQGSGETSAWKGRMVRTTGVVTQVAAKRAGFWIQDPAGDGDPKTSDGLYVSAAGLPADAVFPEVKDAVRVTGEADEESKKDELPRTRLRDVSRVEVLAKGNPLPEPVVLSHLPEGLAAWEALEGMRVRVEDAAAAKLVGVVDYASGSYRVEPEVSEVVSRETPRTR